MAASSSSSSNYHTSRTSTRCTSYDVFLSFGDADTRLGFTDHLCNALVDAKINTFNRDKDELERGESIDSELYKAIYDSRCSVIVLSKDYASSESCLFELVTILEHKRISDHIVLPVFYNVDPDTMWGEKGCYKEAFDRHKERFKDDIIGKVDRWREALKEASELAGMNLKNQADRHEASFIKKIVNVVQDKLRRIPLSVTPYLIGTDSQLENINSWLQGGSSTDVGVLLICGVSGIGKTTIAKSVYNSNFKRFEGSAFLENISSELSGQPGGLVNLQRKLLSILTKREVKIHNVSEGTERIKDTIRSKRIILVLDDVDKFEILEALIGMREWFCLGSKIIITTRQHTELLKAREVYKVHEVKQLEEGDSLELFCWHAFGQGHPIDEHYKQLSLKIVDHCGGLPLALQTLGRSSISWENIDYWENAIKKLEDIPNSDILGKLKISYDSLLDDDDRNLFLEIACFFIGEDTDFIVSVLNGCNFHTKIGIQNLINRYLIMIDDENNEVRMHNLLRDMGREIIRQESPKEPGQRSRLWKSKDSFNVLNEKRGENSVEGVFLHRWNILSVNPNDPLVSIETNAFAKMDKLRLLILNYVQLNRSYESFVDRLISLICSRGYEAFPRGLRWLSWHGFPLDSIPSDFPFQNLVALDMRHSNLKRVWKLPKPLPVLKILNLSHSQYLTETPDFSLLPKLERLIVCECVNLVHVHETVCTLEFLKTLDISGCTNLTRFPLSELWKMKALKVFRANNSPICRWRKTVGEVKPLAVSWPPLLVELNLANCSLHNDDFPRDLNNLSSLQSLDLGQNQISVLPDCIRSLNELNHLSFFACQELQSLIGLPRVKHLNVTFCNSLEKVTFQSASCKPQTVASLHYRNLLEFEYWFKVEPIGSIDVEMINIFRLENLERMQDINIKITSTAWATTKTHPIQGIHEHGIFNIFLPLSAIPGSCGHSRRTSMSFIWPRFPTKIQGLNFSIIYAVHFQLIDPTFSHLMIEVKNNNKGQKWIYIPTFFGYSADFEKKDMIWLSHWKLGDQYLECGDKITVSVFVDPRSIDCIQVKDLDIQIVCGNEQNICTREYIENSEVGGISDFLPDNHKVIRGTYFIYGLPMTREFRETLWRLWENSMSNQRKRMEEFDANLEKAMRAHLAAIDNDHQAPPARPPPSEGVDLGGP